MQTGFAEECIRRMGSDVFNGSLSERLEQFLEIYKAETEKMKIKETHHDINSPYIHTLDFSKLVTHATKEELKTLLQW